MHSRFPRQSVFCCISFTIGTNTGLNNSDRTVIHIYYNYLRKYDGNEITKMNKYLFQSMISTEKPLDKHDRETTLNSEQMKRKMNMSFQWKFEKTSMIFENFESMGLRRF